MINSEIEHLVRIMSKLPGLGLRSARRIVLHLLNNKEKDRLIERLDFICRKLAGVSKTDETSWYMDRCFLAAISPLCLCTNNVMLAIFSLFDQVELFLILLISLMNIYGLSLLIWKTLKWKIKVASKLT